MPTDKIITSVPVLRDPCVLVEDGAYYMYGTGWVCYKNTDGRLDGSWSCLGKVVSEPDDDDGCEWAPEVHKYNGAYYMFTTYKSKATGHRGCGIFRSERPEGPFTLITDGAFTPKDWDSIEATFYVDEDGQPWTVFVHEWTSTDDHIGRMCAAKLSDDLTRLISEPIELFRADAPVWANAGVTDGCWMHLCADGRLLMIWSNFNADGYCVGVARSQNGKIDGVWTQDEELLYSKALDGSYDGGHGMIFTDTDGKMYLSIHSPNASAEGRPHEIPIFVPVVERDGRLVWDR